MYVASSCNIPICLSHLISSLLLSVTDSLHQYVILSFCTLGLETNNDTSPQTLKVFVIIEYLAYLWYTLSYIPYARSAVL